MSVRMFLLSSRGQPRYRGQDSHVCLWRVGHPMGRKRSIFAGTRPAGPMMMAVLFAVMFVPSVAALAQTQPSAPPVRSYSTAIPPRPATDTLASSTDGGVASGGATKEGDPSRGGGAV